MKKKTVFQILLELDFLADINQVIQIVIIWDTIRLTIQTQERALPLEMVDIVNVIHRAVVQIGIVNVIMLIIDVIMIGGHRHRHRPVHRRLEMYESNRKKMMEKCDKTQNANFKKLRFQTKKSNLTK